MSTFKENLKATPSVKVLSRCIPDIMISQDALIKMQLFVENCSDEVGWLGTAYKDTKKNLILINDVFLFEQEVHSTTTEITPEGLSNFGEAILQQADGMEIWNNLKVWGHSHVNMSVFPSGQDDNQMETFADGGHDWFIRIIANKKGEMRVCLYNYDLGITFNDLPWYETSSSEEQIIEEKITQLYKLLDEMQKSKLTKYETDIKKEIELKVKKKSYTQTPNIAYLNNTMGTMTNMMGTTKGSDIQDTKKKENEKASEVEQGRIETDEDVYYWCDEDMLLDIGDCTTMAQVDDVLDMYGYTNFFDLLEKDVVWKTARDFTYHYYEDDKIKK